VDLVLLRPRALAHQERDDVHNEGVPQVIGGNPAAVVGCRVRIIGVAVAAADEDVGDVVNETVGDRLLPLPTELRATREPEPGHVGDLLVEATLAGQGGHLEGLVSERLGH